MAQLGKLLLISFLAILVSKAKPNAFDDYIAMPDPTYTYRVIPESTRRVEGEFTAYVLNMTSQTWLTGRFLINY